MNTLFLFVLTTAISFAGSIHIGPVNLVVIRTSLKNDLKLALYVGIGGSLPELLYAGMAVFGLNFLKEHPEALEILNKMTAPFFIILSIYYFLPKKRREKKFTVTHRHSLSTGIMLALFNPQLLPFWFASLIYLNSILPVETLPDQLAFIAGTACGAFALLSLYAFLANTRKEKMNVLLQKFNFDRLMGITFLAMGVFKLLL